MEVGEAVGLAGVAPLGTEEEEGLAATVRQTAQVALLQTRPAPSQRLPQRQQQLRRTTRRRPLRLCSA